MTLFDTSFTALESFFISSRVQSGCAADQFANSGNSANGVVFATSQLSGSSGFSFVAFFMTFCDCFVRVLRHSIVADRSSSYALRNLNAVFPSSTAPDSSAATREGTRLVAFSMARIPSFPFSSSLNASTASSKAVQSSLSSAAGVAAETTTRVERKDEWVSEWVDRSTTRATTNGLAACREREKVRTRDDSSGSTRIRASAGRSTQATEGRPREDGRSGEGGGDRAHRRCSETREGRSSARRGCVSGGRGRLACGICKISVGRDSATPSCDFVPA